MKYGHFVRDCPDKSVKAVEEGDWGQAYNPNVTLILTDSNVHGYGKGKSNWHNVVDNSQSSHEPIQSQAIPIPDNSWTRAERSNKSPAKRLNVMAKCEDSCNCEHDSQWVALDKMSHDADNYDFPTVQEAVNIIAEPTRAHMPKLPRKKKQASNKTFQGKQEACHSHM